MKTHDVEEQLGITKQALIYYEKEGLINPIRDKNNYRQYTQNDIEILQVILLLCSFEISIDEIKLVFSEKLSIRSCLNTKQNYLENEKNKIKKIEEKIKEYTKRTKVEIGNNGIELEDDYIRFTYSNEKMEYGKNEINVDDVQSVDISLCCSKGEKDKYFIIYNLYFICLDINTIYDTYSIQIMNNSQVLHFFRYLKSLNITINDPMELIKLFEEKKEYIEVYYSVNKNFSKWQKQYHLEIQNNVIKEYMESLKVAKNEDVPSIKEQLSELKNEYKNIFKK
ncbi:MAG TPA: MerR family transcriptional regulator [Coprobacillaceae bacterium]|nr:MerR family transcriptional regulator [Coprobacillaceae bacterium]